MDIAHVPIERPSDYTQQHAPPGFLAWLAALVHAYRGRRLAYARRCGLVLASPKGGQPPLDPKT